MRDNLEASRYLDIDQSLGFGLENLPYGVFSTLGSKPHIGVRINNHVLDLSQFELEGYFKLFPDQKVFHSSRLNDFAALGPKKCSEIRKQIQDILTSLKSPLKNSSFHQKVFIPLNKVQMHLPFYTRGYTDFYSSEVHATNVGKLFRDAANALPKSWKYLPIAYHGRSSSLIISDTPIVRPAGQILRAGLEQPVFLPSERLDFEVEMGIFIGQSNRLSEAIPLEEAEKYIFGLVILNDWSARDIQSFEYQPLGPFLGKNFATSISPWVVPIEALTPFKVPMGPVDIKLVSYLEETQRNTLDIDLELTLKTNKNYSQKLIKTNFKHQYWSMNQQISHHTVNGCNLEIGDLLGTGTISGPDPSSWGCLLEITQNGKNPLVLDNQENRKFLMDEDEITIEAHSQKTNGMKISFGQVRNKIIKNPSFPNS